MDQCNLCGHEEHQKILKLRGEGKYLERCKRCSLVFLNVEARKEAADFCQHRDVSTDTRPSFRESHSAFFEHFFQRSRLRPGRVLDIGCGTGLFLSLAREKGWDVQGVEISHQAVEIARSQYGLPVLEGGIEGLSFPDESFDLVTLWNVLDFLEDPKGALLKLQRILKKGGVLFIRVINIRFHLWVYRLWRLMYPGGEGEVPPTVFHIYNFSEGTLRRMLKQSGFEKLHVGNSPLTPDDPYQGSSRFSKREVQRLKGLVGGVSSLLFYGTFGRFCLGSSLLARGLKE